MDMMTTLGSWLLMEVIMLDCGWLIGPGMTWLLKYNLETWVLTTLGKPLGKAMLLLRYFINPRRVCTARVTLLGLCVCVCLSVCHQLFWHYRLQGGPWAIPTASKQREPENKNGVFPEATAFGKHGVKTSEKTNMHNSAGVPWPDPLALCTLEA